MQRKLHQEPLQSRNFPRESKKSIVPVGPEALKVSKAHLERNRVNTQHWPSIAQSRSREYNSLIKRDQLNRIKELSGVEASRNDAGCGRRTV